MNCKNCIELNRDISYYILKYPSIVKRYIHLAKRYGTKEFLAKFQFFIRSHNQVIIEQQEKLERI